MCKKLIYNKIIEIKKECHDQSLVTVKNKTITIKNKELNVDMSFYVSKGNKKLPKSCYIFNISSSHNCISNKLGLCNLGSSNKCYAFKAEKQYKDCLKCRNNQETCWNEIKDKNLIYEFILGLLLMSYKSTKNSMKTLRLNECGDIKDILDIIYFELIATHLTDIGVTTYTYTHRIDLINSIKYRTENLIVNGSDFMLHNEFRVVDKFTNNPNNLKCHGNCDTCNYCKIKLNKVIEIELH